MDLSYLAYSNGKGYCDSNAIFTNDEEKEKFEESLQIKSEFSFCYKQLSEDKSIEWLYPELIEIRKKQKKRLEDIANNLSLHKPSMWQEMTDKKKWRENALSPKTATAMQKIIDEKNLWKNSLNPKTSVQKIIDEQKPQGRFLEDIIQPTELMRSQAKMAQDFYRKNKSVIKQAMESQKNVFEFNKPHGVELSLVRSESEKALENLGRVDKWKDRIEANANLIGRLDNSMPLNKRSLVADLEVKKLINLTPAYLNTAKIALSSFDQSLNHRDILSRIHNYTTATDQMLSVGINADIARNMLEPHRALLENYRYWEKHGKPKEKTKKELKKESEKSRLEIEILKEQIAILKEKTETFKEKLREKDLIISALASSATENEKKLDANKKRVPNNKLVKWQGQKVKLATKEKYERWQRAVDAKYKSHPYLSHSAICVNIASSLKTTSETIRKNTRLTTS